MTAMSTDDRAILVDSRRLRLFTLFILYVAQGVPIGLFWFAIPTWMATNGADAADVGYVLGLTALPWTLKLVNGFISNPNNEFEANFVPVMTTGARAPLSVGGGLVWACSSAGSTARGKRARERTCMGCSCVRVREPAR